MTFNSLSFSNTGAPSGALLCVSSEEIDGRQGGCAALQLFLLRHVESQVLGLARRLYRHGLLAGEVHGAIPATW